MAAAEASGPTYPAGDAEALPKGKAWRGWLWIAVLAATALAVIWKLAK